MVLESLTNPEAAEKNPKKLFLLGILYSSVAVMLSLWVFRDNASIIMVFLTTIACIPLIYNTIKLEEKKDETPLPERMLLKEHGRALSFLMFLFLGMVVSLTFWYVFLPSDITEDLFSTQSSAIASINKTPTGQVVGGSLFSRIFFNNIQVLIFSIIFAFIYGVGAIFILTWNASVIATAMGNFIRLGLNELVSTIGFVNVGSYFKVFSLSVFRYFIHGIPEIMAYFTAGLAAGIISIAVLRHRMDFHKFKKVVIDSTDLLLVSLVLLLVAAVLEVYVTPLFF